MNCSRGFSLYDLLITLAIGSILVTGGTSVVRLVNDTSQTAEINTLVSLLNLARSTAVSRQQDIIFCPSDDGRRCSDKANDFSWWHKGVLLFTDDNGNREVDSTDIVLRRHISIDAQLSVKSSRHRSRLVYRANGFSSGTNMTFTICGKRAAAETPPRYIVVSNTGRARISAKPADGRINEREETCV
jgi:type IV fimbrial biogenesis protein FimT